METVAFYGAGLLGSGFVQGLRRRGADVRVWNRTFSKAKALEQYGAKAFERADDAARGASRVHLCLRDDAAVDATLDAALPGIEPGALVVDHTTVAPSGVANRAARLEAAGLSFVHAPVFMGPPNAVEGSGIMLCSPPRSLYERAKPSLEPMTGTLWYLGDRIDKAAVFKLFGNAMILAVVGGLNDVFTIAEVNDLTRVEALSLFERFKPEGQIGGRGKRMAQGDYDPTWTLDMAHKDALMMIDAAEGRDLPVIATIEASMRAAMERGLAARDLAAIAARAG
ncbi:MAG: NAD(P)-dependent oxidoreductase [Vulcanimicrobiaceae bacterium]